MGDKDAGQESLGRLTLWQSPSLNGWGTRRAGVCVLAPSVVMWMIRWALRNGGVQSTFPCSASADFPCLSWFQLLKLFMCEYVFIYKCLHTNTAPPHTYPCVSCPVQSLPIGTWVYCLISKTRACISGQFLVLNPNTLPSRTNYSFPFPLPYRGTSPTDALLIFPLIFPFTKIVMKVSALVCFL